MFADLRERVAERLILRFGTAMDSQLLVNVIREIERVDRNGVIEGSEIERAQGVPARIGFRIGAVAARLVVVDPAARAEALAVRSAERHRG